MWLPPLPWIEKAIRIDSVTDRSNLEMVRFLTPLLKDAGLTVQEHRVVENGIAFINIVALSHPDAPMRDLMVFHTHMDTVSPGPKENWTKTGGDPFCATKVRDRVYGLGTADVKLDFLCKILAAKTAAPWAKPFALVGSYGEERGLVGIQKLLEEFPITPKYALVGEPSNLELIYAHKGHLLFSIDIDLGSYPDGTDKVWKGQAAHSSTPALGVNAVRKALQDIRKKGLGISSLVGGTDSNRIPDHCTATCVPHLTPQTKNLFRLMDHLDAFGKELQKRRDARFSPSYNTLSLNWVRRIEGKTRLTFDIRVLPNSSADRFKERVLELEKLFDCKIAELTIDPPLKGKKESRFIKLASQALRKAGTKPVQRTKASSTEAAVYQKKGAEAMVFGPGISVGNVHRPNEYNSFKQLAIATRFYTEMLKLVAGDH